MTESHFQTEGFSFGGFGEDATGRFEAMRSSERMSPMGRKRPVVLPPNTTPDALGGPHRGAVVFHLPVNV